MLIEFSVANFRSFSERQRLSLSAGRFQTERPGTITNTVSKRSPRILRTAAILGANGSGKSNIALALDFLQTFVASSAQSTQLGDKIPVQPHKLDDKLKQSPSDFEIIFCHNGVEYQYSLSLSRDRVCSEVLHSQSQKSPLREVFSRVFENGSEIWNLGSLPKEQATLWQQSTRPNASFLSTAVQLNSEQLAPPFEWLTGHLRVQTSRDSFYPELTSHLIKDHIEDGCRDEVMNILREADLGIFDIAIEEEEFDDEDLPDDIPEQVRSSLVARLKGQKTLSPSFRHKTREGSLVRFEPSEESDGTMRLYEMVGAWVLSLRHGYTLVVDEIDSSLHPLLVRLLVELFQNPTYSPCASQLIFTTHDDGLLDAGILERDQFWFVEKRRGSSKLIPLLDYRPRKTEALRRNYLKGRYGGIPALAHVSRSS